MRGSTGLNTSSRMRAFTITFIYALIGSVYIIVSDNVLNYLIHDPAAVQNTSIIKGWVYVLATSILIYCLVKMSMNRLSAAFENIGVMNSELIKKEAFNRAVMDNLPIGIAVNTYPDFKFVYMNDRFPLFYQTTREALMKGSFWDEVFEDPALRSQFRERVLEAIECGDQSRMCWENVPVTRAGRETKYISAYASPVPGENLIISTVADVTERRKVEENFKHLSYHDHLTELFNRRFFEVELKRLDAPRNLPLTVVMGDVNGLKLINDSFGHEVGDRLLRKAAKIIHDSCRRDDIIARIGGDEFGIILPGSGAEEAEKIIARIQGQPIDIGQVGSLISVSFGYATKAEESQAIHAIQAEAENLMYKHKMYDGASMRNKTVSVVMDALFEKDERESLHSRRVSDICAAIASELGFDNDRINKIRISGLIHDIGKIGIDEKILSKPGKLNGAEWEEIKRHPEAGYRILSSVSEFSELAESVLSHHERWDGMGYPRGLRGEDISIEARIIALADAFDAMTQDRSYRKAMSCAQALEEIKNNAGVQFDPMITDIFVSRLLCKGYDFLGG